MNLTSEEHRQFAREAKKRGMSQAALAREVIQKFLARTSKKTPR